MRSTYLLALLVAGAQATVLTLQSPLLTVTTSGTQSRKEALSPTGPIAPVTLKNDDTLKITFQVVEEEGGKGVQPHQTFIRFYDSHTGEEGIQPIRVTAGGKARFELNMAKPPQSLPPTSDAPLHVTLLIGAPAHSPLSLHLFDLIVPASAPASVHPDEASFHPLPEIHHSFRSEPTLPPQPISLVFSALVLTPWIALLSLWGRFAPGVSHLFSPSIFPFVLTLGGFEALLVWYWVDLKLGQVLLYGGFLTFITILTGKQALSKISDRRVGRK